MNYKYIKTDYLDTVTGGDKDLVIELVAIFRQQSFEFYDDMSRLYRDKNYVELGLLAHKAKSSVAIMGMDKMAGMLKEMEIEARKGSVNENFKEVIETFRNETEGALKELDSYIATL